MEEFDFGKSKKSDKVLPVKLTANSRLKFRCHKDVKCFTACCSNVSIALPPFDLMRIKKRLGISTGEFLEKYGDIQVLEKTLLPVVTLRMRDDEKKSCPFVTPDGCTIYEDRPNICRYYPMGMATLRKKDTEAGKDEFYFLVKEDHCLGFEEDKEWTIGEWRKDQGADLYDEMNRGWMEVLIKKKSFGQHEFPEDKNKMFFLVSTDLDAFRLFVFETSFLQIYDIPDEKIEKLRTDDNELLKFGYEWLKFSLFAEDTLTMRDNDVVAGRKAKIIAKANERIAANKKR
jgi:hypothetical protein